MSSGGCQGKGVALWGDGPDECQRIGLGNALLIHVLKVLAELDADAAGGADGGIVDGCVHIGHAQVALPGRLGDAQAEGCLARVDTAEQDDAAAGDQALDDLGIRHDRHSYASLSKVTNFVFVLPTGLTEHNRAPDPVRGQALDCTATRTPWKKSKMETAKTCLEHDKPL